MIQKNISITKTARYYVLGEPSDKIEQVWFVCHGYAELAKYFIKKFEILNNGKTIIVAPEALNRFYSKGFSGRVGASWMTKDERESEIEDYINYLNSVYKEVTLQLSNPKLKTIALGFSQGTATVARWVANKSAKIDQLILWSGFYPHDLEFEKDKAFINALNTKVVMGKNDEFYSNNIVDENYSGLSKEGINYELVYFEGGHEIHQETLVKLSSSF